MRPEHLDKIKLIQTLYASKQVSPVVYGLSLLNIIKGLLEDECLSEALVLFPLIPAETLERLPEFMEADEDFAKIPIFIHRYLSIGCVIDNSSLRFTQSKGDA